MAAILKKDEKIESVLKKMPDNYSDDDVVQKFMEDYPDDVRRMRAKYNKEERHTKEGKTHPMPTPERYIKNALNVYRKKQIK